MTSDLRECCQRAAIDGVSPERHFPLCDARAEDPQAGALFDLPAEPPRGGQHL